jgi:hypothetical protein
MHPRLTTPAPSQLMPTAAPHPSCPAGRARGAVCQLVALTAEASAQLLTVLQLSPLEQQAAASAAPGAWDGGLRFDGSIRLLRSNELQLVSQPSGGPAAGSAAGSGAGAAAGLDRLLGLAGGQQVRDGTLDCALTLQLTLQAQQGRLLLSVSHALPEGPLVLCAWHVSTRVNWHCI